ncbi:MAG TPA: hypothetical protein PLD62_01785 [Candidatus Cloacimonadota bacterium]|nr:hypothetical protein [Candidatus Cloacimonadota bacterium]
MKLRRIIFLFFCILILAGCTDKAVIKITNETDYDEIWYQLQEDEVAPLQTGETKELKYDLNDYLIASESKKVSLSYGGKFVITKDRKIEVSAGDTRKIDILTDAGEIVITNGYFNSFISRIYIVEAGKDFSKASNLLSNPLQPWNYETFNVHPGFWDIKVIINEGGEPVYRYNVYVGLEQTYYIEFTEES